MRVLTSISMLAGALLLSTACSPGAPFTNIKTVTVRHIGKGGLQSKIFSPPKMQELVQCLYTTTEITEEQTKEELLQTTYLIEVTDNLGDRSFELYTTENLKGNKGKYYVNHCIHKLIQAAK